MVHKYVGGGGGHKAEEVCRLGLHGVHTGLGPLRINCFFSCPTQSFAYQREGGGDGLSWDPPTIQPKNHFPRGKNEMLNKEPKVRGPL